MSATDGEPPEHRVNDQITAPEVRVVDIDGRQLGVMPVREALVKARGRALDLVEVSAISVPPVCRIMDHSATKWG